jgi:hypothetical protein
VVDTSGVIKVYLEGDHSTIHTKDSAFRKAYTVVTMGRSSVSTGPAPLSRPSTKIRQAPARHFSAFPIRTPCRRGTHRRAVGWQHPILENSGKHLIAASILPFDPATDIRGPQKICDLTDG